MIQLGQQTGLFDVTCTQDAEADFTKENLAKYEEKFGEVRLPSETGFQAPDRTIGFKH